MIMLNTLPPYRKPASGKRSWKTSRNHWGYTLNFIKRGKHRGISPLFRYWLLHNHFNESADQRAIKQLLFHAWHATLTPTQRAAWRTAAGSVTLQNYKGISKTPTGYALFIRHNYQAIQIDPILHNFPPPNQINILATPPNPYVIPPTPHDLTVISANSASLNFSVAWDGSAYAGTNFVEMRYLRGNPRVRSSAWLRAQQCVWFFSSSGPTVNAVLFWAYPFRNYLGPCTVMIRLRRPRTADTICSDPLTITQQIP